MRAIGDAWLSVVSWLYFLADSPQEGPHFSSDRGDRDRLTLAREDHFSIARDRGGVDLSRLFRERFSVGLPTALAWFDLPA